MSQDVFVLTILCVGIPLWCIVVQLTRIADYCKKRMG